MYRRAGYAGRNAFDATQEVTGARPPRSHPRSWRGRIGEVVHGKWRVEAIAHQSLTTTKYDAVHIRNGRRVALEVLTVSTPAIREKFQHEGLVANTIGHPAVVKFLDDGVTDDGAPYLVMERLDSASLLQMHDEAGGVLPANDIVRWSCQLLDVLATAHDRGIVHRGVKAATVHVTRAGSIKLLDFSTAYVGESSTKDGEVVDPHEDIQAVGALLKMLFDGQEMPRAIGPVIERALAGQNRWEDARAMREALRWAAQSLPGYEEEIPAKAFILGETPEERRTLAGPFDTTAPDERVTTPNFDSIAPTTVRTEDEPLPSTERPTIPRRRVPVARILGIAAACAFVVAAFVAPRPMVERVSHEMKGRLAASPAAEPATAPAPAPKSATPVAPRAVRVARAPETFHVPRAEIAATAAPAKATKRRNADWLTRKVAMATTDTTEEAPAAATATAPEPEAAPASAPESADPPEENAGD